MTMILGLVAAFAFMIFCNEFEIGKKTCKAHFGPAPYAGIFLSFSNLLF